MTCPLCHSQRVSCPTKDISGGKKIAHIKSGPATCLSCGAHEVRTGPATRDGKGKLWTWVPATQPEA